MMKKTKEEELETLENYLIISWNNKDNNNNNPYDYQKMVMNGYKICFMIIYFSE